MRHSGSLIAALGFSFVATLAQAKTSVTIATVNNNDMR